MVDKLRFILDNTHIIPINQNKMQVRYETGIIETFRAYPLFYYFRI
jgi:hypothetical protein